MHGATIKMDKKLFHSIHLVTTIKSWIPDICVTWTEIGLISIPVHSDIVVNALQSTDFELYSHILQVLNKSNEAHAMTLKSAIA